MSTIVSCIGVSMRFGSTHALEHVDLSLPAGPPIALVGPNGAGKTTLLAIFCGFLRPSQGQVRVLGAKPGSTTLLGRIGALPQDAQFDPRFSVGRQLRHLAQLQGMANDQARTEAARVLELVGLSDCWAKKPHTLSHGMRKRILIAQAFLGTPEVIFLDEPTAGLDPQNMRVVRELISRQSERVTFLISSHNLDEVEKLCATVLHISGGQLKEQVAVNEIGRERFLTIVLANSLVDIDAVVGSLTGMQEVDEVSVKSGGALVLKFDAHAHPQFDQTLLQHLAQHGWPYRQLINGRALEDRLYS